MVFVGERNNKKVWKCQATGGSIGYADNKSVGLLVIQNVILVARRWLLLYSSSMYKMCGESFLERQWRFN